MATRPIGTVFIDFDANFEPVTKGQAKLLKDATTTSENIEDAFRKLGVKSSAEFDLMRAKIQRAYEAIATSGKATANDLVRAEQAKTQQLAALHEQQYGKQVSLAESLKDSLNAIHPGLAQLLTVTGALTAAIGGLGLAAKSSVAYFKEMAFEVRDLAYLSGGTTEQISGLLDVVTDFGVEAETVNRAMVFLSRAIYEGSPAIEKLGLAIRDGNGHLKTAHDMFYEVINALHGMRSETERNAIAQELFSRGWIAMVPIIERGAASLRDAAKESQLLFSKEDLARAEEYRRAMTDLGDQIDRIKKLAATEIIVPITIVLKGAAGVLDWLTSGAKAAEEQILGPEALLQKMIGEESAFLAKQKTGAPEGKTPGEKKRDEAATKAAIDAQKKALQDYLDTAKRTADFEADWAKATAEAWGYVHKTIADSYALMDKGTTDFQASYEKFLASTIEQQLAIEAEEQNRLATKVDEENRIREEARERDLKAYFAYIDEMLAKDFEAQKLYAEMDEERYRQKQEQYWASYQYAAQSFGNIAAAAQAMYQVMGSQHKEWFRIWQAAKIAETIVNTYSAAVATFNAVVNSTGGGWWSYVLATAAAASVVAWGMAQVATIASQSPTGGGGGGGTGGPSTPGGAYAYTPAVDTYGQQQTESPRPMAVNVHVYGSYIGDKDTFARDISDSLRKAWEDGA